MSWVMVVVGVAKAVRVVGVVGVGVAGASSKGSLVWLVVVLVLWLLVMVLVVLVRVLLSVVRSVVGCLAGRRVVRDWGTCLLDSVWNILKVDWKWERAAFVRRRREESFDRRTDTSRISRCGF